MKLGRLYYGINYNYGLFYIKNNRTWYEFCHHYENLWDWGYYKGMKDQIKLI